MAFAIISGLAAIPGVVFLALNINVLARSLTTPRPTNISSIAVNSLILIVYASYICVSIFHIVAYSRISRSDNNANSTQVCKSVNINMKVDLSSLTCLKEIPLFLL